MGQVRVLLKASRHAARIACSITPVMVCRCGGSESSAGGDDGLDQKGPGSVFQGGGLLLKQDVGCLGPLPMVLKATTYRLV
jgi:hypothetical protein